MQLPSYTTTSGEFYIPNSITSKSSEHCDTARVVEDLIQNHLPGDSGGTDISIEYLIHGSWLPHEIAKYSDVILQATAVRISDDGRNGYCYTKLGLEYSEKPEARDDQFDSGGEGEFGEGLKRACASAIVNGFAKK